MIRRELPVSVDIGSEKYEIDADFRTIMNIEGIIFEKEVTEDQKNFAKEMMKEIEIKGSALNMILIILMQVLCRIIR